MTMKAKTTIILLFTLVLGIVLGVFLDRTIMKFHFQKRFKEVRQPRGITKFLESLIQPDETQHKAVKDILEKYSKRLHDQREKSFQEMDVVMDSLRVELDQILTGEQKARLKQHLERMKQRRERRPKPGEMPPPPPGSFEEGREKPPGMDEGQVPPPPPE